MDGVAAGTDVLSGEEHIVLRCLSRDASGFQWQALSQSWHGSIISGPRFRVVQSQQQM